MHTYTYVFRHKNGVGSCAVGDFPRPTHCHECHKPVPGPEGCSVGYGSRNYRHVGDTRDGTPIEQAEAICYDCCHKADVASLLDRSKPLCAYISSDGKHVSNWPGDILGTVTYSSASRTDFGRSKITHYRVRDVHGAMWYGKNSGAGTYITLRPCKGGE